MAEQLWLCLFACAFLHIHHVSDECHKISDMLAIVPENICCCHGQNAGHENRHTHSIPGPAKQLSEEDGDFCVSGTEMVSGNTFHIANAATVANETVYYRYVIDIPVIKKHNMRC